MFGGCARAMDSLNVGTWASHSPSTWFGRGLLFDIGQALGDLGLGAGEDGPHTCTPFRHKH